MTQAQHDGRDKPQAEEKSEYSEVMAQTAKDFDIRLGTSDGERAELREQPLLQFSNVIRAQIPEGADYLWLHRGRPVAVSSMWIQERGSPYVSQFLHSLHGGPLVVMWRGERIWAPRQSGADFKTIPGASVPAESTDRRGLQMRSLIRSFSASSRGAEQGGRHELRLLPHPLYRYQTNEPNLLDGAIFSFVQGNDAEVLVILEARRVAESKDFAWHYACVRFSHLELEVSYKGEEIWTADLARPRGDPAGPYTYFYAPVELARKRPDSGAKP